MVDLFYKVDDLCTGQRDLHLYQMLMYLSVGPVDICWLFAIYQARQATFSFFVFPVARMAVAVGCGGRQLVTALTWQRVGGTRGRIYRICTPVAAASYTS